VGKRAGGRARPRAGKCDAELQGRDHGRVLRRSGGPADSCPSAGSGHHVPTGNEESTRENIARSSHEDPPGNP
jgi:hypothetical protein